MYMLWLACLWASICPQIGIGIPVIQPTPETYPYGGDNYPVFPGWSSELLAVMPAFAVIITAVTVIFGCMWCLKHKDCKLFNANASNLREVRCTISPEPVQVNNNISEDNNNGPISLREMQNIANNNAAAYIVSENEERNRTGRESVIEFEPLPASIGVHDPLERCADWFGEEDLPRSRLQYLREIDRGWFGRVVEGEFEDEGTTTTVAVKILKQNATLEEKAQFLDETKLYRDVRHENLLAFVGKCLQEDPWLLILEFFPMNLHEYLVMNRPNMAVLNEQGLLLRLMCDISSALAYLHSHGYIFGEMCSRQVSMSDGGERPRCVLGRYSGVANTTTHATRNTMSTDVWCLGTLLWEMSSWGSEVRHHPPPPSDISAPYQSHLYQLMQLCWNQTPDARPTAAEVFALLNHLYSTHMQTDDITQDNGYTSTDFEERWQSLKPNVIPIIDEHVAMVHVPSTSTAYHFTESDQDDNIPTTQDSLSFDVDTAVSRSSSIMSDKVTFSLQNKSDSLTNLHGSLEDVRNIYLMHNETVTIECNKGNNALKDKNIDNDKSDSSVSPWLKGIISGSQDDVSYYKDVSDAIKNLDNILNSEKTSSSESSHHASPSRDSLSLDCKKDYPVQSSLVKSPGINNFQYALEMDIDSIQENDLCVEDDGNQDTIDTLSHSFGRYSDTTSIRTLENFSPSTPTKDITTHFTHLDKSMLADKKNLEEHSEHRRLPNQTVDISINILPKLRELCVASISNLSLTNKFKNETSNIREDCQVTSDNLEKIGKTNLSENDDEPVDTAKSELKKSSSPNEQLYAVQKFETSATKCKEFIAECRYYEDMVNKSIENEDSNCKPLLPEKEVDSYSVSFKEKNNRLEILPHTENTVNKYCLVEKQINDIQRENEIVDSKLQTSDDITLSYLNCTNKEDETAIQQYKSENILVASHKMESFNSLDTLHDQVNLNKSDNDENDPKAGSTCYLKSNEFHELTSPSISLGEANRTESELQQVDILFPSDRLNSEEKISLQSESQYKKMEENISKLILNNSRNGSETLNCFDDQQNFQPSSNEIVVANNCSQDPALKSASFIIQGADNDNSDLYKNVTLEHNDINRTKCDKKEVSEEVSLSSTVYMSLVNDINHEVINPLIGTDYPLQGCSLFETSNEESMNMFFEDSTRYLDLPSRHQQTEIFLESERNMCSPNINFDNFSASTPKDNNIDVDTFEDNCEESEPKVSNVCTEVTQMKQEQSYMQENLLESPTNSHHTDTYDENSSVVLGPFENYTLELYKGVKSIEEFPAFASNFSEIDLETPSPLRDGNFLNEVPDIVHEEVPCNIMPSLCELNITGTVTVNQASPSTPPNSSRNYLTSSSHKDNTENNDDINEPVNVVNNSQPNINEQIELQITTRLAIAENENNINIEYAGPLNEEEQTTFCSDAVPESYLAGNGGSDLTCRSLNEDSMAALRNELELKLPLAQVTSIEPQNETDSWCTELPPPPELILSSALSPITEETGQQLKAYENDLNWYSVNLTDSSSSYLEPCNNSEEDSTSVPSGVPTETLNCTYTVQSLNDTLTAQKNNIDGSTDKAITMSADSLNASNTGNPDEHRDHTYYKVDEGSCEAISPFILSPTSQTSILEHSKNITTNGFSTLSKTVQSSDAKLSKASETQCVSKATSIDSWCSNDTLYNVEENFDDILLDQDNEESSHTEIQVDNEKAFSNPTYIIHEGDSTASNSFTTLTYTKPKDEATTPPVLEFKVNGSDYMTLKKDSNGDLINTYSICSTENMSVFEYSHKFRQPELVRKSSYCDEYSLVSPKNINEINNETIEETCSPRLTSEPTLKKIKSVEIDSSIDNLSDKPSEHRFEDSHNTLINDITDYQNVVCNATSTPLIETKDEEIVEPISLPQMNYDSHGNFSSIPDYQAFVCSAELKCQDLTDAQKIPSESMTPTIYDNNLVTVSPTIIPEHSENYIDFENSVKNKPQELSSIVKKYTNTYKDSLDRTLMNSNYLDGDNIMNNKSSIEKLELSPTALNVESHNLIRSECDKLVEINFGEDETEQPHSIIVIESTVNNISYNDNDDNSHVCKKNTTLDSPSGEMYVNTSKESFKQHSIAENGSPEINPNAGIIENENRNGTEEEVLTKILNNSSNQAGNDKLMINISDDFFTKPSSSIIIANHNTDMVLPNGTSEVFATVSFLNETFEELVESSVDDRDSEKNSQRYDTNAGESLPKLPSIDSIIESTETFANINDMDRINDFRGEKDTEISSVTQNFLLHERKYQFDMYPPLLTDIRFSGPASDIVSTSFNEESPIKKPPCDKIIPEVLKDWESDSDSQSTNSSSTEFIWKDGEGHETSIVSTIYYENQQEDGKRDGLKNGQASENHEQQTGSADLDSAGSGDSGSGSEGDEVEFVPSSWDCRAAPAKSSLRSLEQTSLDNKKRVMFKRQKYHCVYEYPREVCDIEMDSPAVYQPDLSTYTDWDSTNNEDAEIGYGQLFEAPSPLDYYPLNSSFAFGPDYGEDFFISSSARPFGLMTSSQFFPGMHVKSSLQEHEIAVEETEEFPPPPSPLQMTTLTHTKAPSLDFTTPDSGVEDITPGSTSEEEFKVQKLPDNDTWKPIESGSSSESISPSSPGESLGGLRHTRDKLKLDLPPSPRIPSPRHSRVFNFVLDKPNRQQSSQDTPASVETIPLVMTDETPVVTNTLELVTQKECNDIPIPEPTFSTFGKCSLKTETEQNNIILTKEHEETEVKEIEANHVKVVEAVKGEGTVLDSGDEDSGIESSKATLERNKPTPNVT